MMSRTLKSRWNAPDTSFLDEELEGYLSRPNPLLTLAPMQSLRPKQRSSEQLAQLSQKAPASQGEFQPDPMSRPRPQMRTGSVTDFDDREVLARTIAGEAGRESFKGQQAVLNVMMNRARNGGYGGKNLRDVALADGQFSTWNKVTGYAKGEGGLDVFNLKPSAEIYGLVDRAMNGNLDDVTGGALNFYNPATSDPKWGARYGGNFPLTIGNHIYGWAK